MLQGLLGPNGAAPPPAQAPSRQKRRRSPLVADMAKAVVLALIPVVAFAVAVLVYENHRTRAEMDDTLLDASRRLTEVIDSELRQQMRTLTALAISTDLDAPLNLSGFYEEARRASLQHSGWLSVALVEASTAQPLLNTARPFGEALPPVSTPADIGEVARSHQPLIASRLGRAGSVIQQPIIALRVPVIRGDTVLYVLSASLSLAAIQDIMSAQLDIELPRLARPAAGAAILDADGRFVARMLEPGKVVGRLASDETRANMQRGPGVYPGRTVEGTETYGAYTRSALTDWSIVVGVPRADADRLGRMSFWGVLAGAVASIVLAGVFVLQFGRDAARRRAEVERVMRLEADARLLEQAQAAIAEKEILLREVHHRLKNNMQTIISLLRTSARHWPEAYQEAIRITVRRMIAMVNVHQQLYRSPNLAELALGPYLESVAREIAVAEGAERRGIRCDIRCDDVRIDLNRALPLGLIMTECLTNAFKHGFPGGRTGAIAITLTKAGETAVLRVRDDGVGVPASVSSARNSLGIDLVEALARQIGGTSATRALSPGTEVRIEFPLPSGSAGSRAA